MYSDLIFDYLRKFNIETGKELNFKKVNFERGISKERYDIKTDEESLKYNKPIGRYELMSIPDTLLFDEEEIRYCTNKLADILKSILGNIKPKDRILVVGLGNRHISSDSLGAKVVGKINITIDNNLLPKVMAISPSVMGLTGIETVDIIEGVILKTKASHIIVIDSLCASSSSRLGRSIQVTNTGICPGKGVGNNRKCIDKNIAPNTFSIGVPLLIYASTFVSETLNENGVTEDKINGIMQSTIKTSKDSEIIGVLKSINKVLNDNLDNMIVSLKDIEECVDILSTIIAGAINIALGVN
ncbi:MAG: GPR endopeptidase [Christensenellales bacterium]